MTEDILGKVTEIEAIREIAREAGPLTTIIQETVDVSIKVTEAGAHRDLTAGDGEVNLGTFPEIEEALVIHKKEQSEKLL